MDGVRRGNHFDFSAVNVRQGAVQVRRSTGPGSIEAQEQAVVAIGCLSLIVLPLLGLVLGGLLGGGTGAKWGAGVGLVLAIGLCGITSYALVKTARSK